jgi:hypothetical protein
MSEASARLSYEASLRLIEEQREEVKELRERTATLIAANALAGSFLGSEALKTSSELGPLGLVAFIISICLCIYVLLPKEGFKFAMRGSTLDRELTRLTDETERYLAVAYWLEDLWPENARRLTELTRFFFTASAFLVIHLVLWSIALATM